MSFSEAQQVLEAIFQNEGRPAAAGKVFDGLKAALDAAEDLAGPDLAFDYLAVCYWEVRSQIEPPDVVKRPIHPALRRMVLERDEYACRWCGATQELTVDHMYVPEVYGGEALLPNLQTLCRSCNSRKGAR